MVRALPRGRADPRQLESEHEGRIKFAKLDIDENLQTASRYEVLSIPTAILFAGWRGAGER